MQAFEFEVDSINNVVHIPSEHNILFNKHLKIIVLINESKTHTDSVNQSGEILTDEFIKNNWRDLLQRGLRNYDETYYKSDEYKQNRGAELMEKYK